MTTQAHEGNLIYLARVIYSSAPRNTDTRLIIGFAFNVIQPHGTPAAGFSHSIPRGFLGACFLREGRERRTELHDRFSLLFETTVTVLVKDQRLLLQHFQLAVDMRSTSSDPEEKSRQKFIVIDFD